MDGEKKQIRCQNCFWYMQSSNGFVCKNPESKYRGAWVSKDNLCERHEWIKND